MAVELYFSNTIESLAEKLCENLGEEIQRKTNILQPSSIVVPNMNLSKWLKLDLAERTGIFMNVNFLFLESGLWEMLKRLDPHSRETNLCDIDHRKIFLFHLLKNLDPANDAIAPISSYLFDSNQNKPGDFETKSWQLAEHLTHLFQEYEYHRLDMIERWIEDDGKISWEMENCQKTLYKMMEVLKKEYGKTTGTRFYTIFEYAAYLLFHRRQQVSIQRKYQGVVHFFGMSQVSDFHLKLIHGLKEFFDIFIYAFNPSREFWEDIKTPDEKRWHKRKNFHKMRIEPQEMEEGELFQEPGDTLLSFWGKTGRENVRLLCRLTGYDFNACFSMEQDRSTVLKAIQSNVLTLENPADPLKRLDQDTSLQIMAAPGRRREVEIVYNSILYNLEHDDSLEMTDIAILVPDITGYRPFFNSVLNMEPVRISYNIVDINAGVESIYGQAVLSILALSQGRFTRKQVFTLLLNPCFMEKWKIHREMIEIWSKWADKLNIFHTFKPDDNPPYDNEPAANVHTWQQGLRRLRLSRIMSGVSFEHEAPPRMFAGLFPYGDMHTTDFNTLESFCEIIEMLHKMVRGLKMKNADVNTWKTSLFFICDQMLQIPDQLKKEHGVRQALENAFDRFGIYDQLTGTQKNAAGIGPDTVKAFIKSHLDGISGGAGDYLTGGVTISALMPMRPIPFKIVYVLGMEEGRFPGKPSVSSLDLRLKKRRIGDVSIPDKNRYLFLEMILSVKEKLYISYVSKDLQKDQLFQPSSVVNQLIRYVEGRILTIGDRFQICEAPLKGNDLTYLNKKKTDLINDCNINYSAGDRIACIRRLGLWNDFYSMAGHDDKQKTLEYMPDFAMTHTTKTSEVERVIPIQTWQLKKFLLDPVRWKLEFHMGIYDDPESLESEMDVEDEPLSVQFPWDYLLKMDTIRQWMGDAFSKDPGKHDPNVFDTLFCQAYDVLSMKGFTATGAFSDMDSRHIGRQGRDLAETLADVLACISNSSRLYQDVVVGGGVDAALSVLDPAMVKHFPAHSLEVVHNDAHGEKTRTGVSISGRIPWMWEDDDNQISAIVVTGAKKGKKDPGKYAIDPILFSLLLSAGDESSRWLDGRPITFYLVYQENFKTLPFNFTPREAAQKLKALVSECLDASFYHWLPFESVAAASKTVEKAVLNSTKEQRSLFFETLVRQFSESEDLLAKISGATVPENAWDIANQRFGDFGFIKP